MNDSMMAKSRKDGRFAIRRLKAGHVGEVCLYGIECMDAWRLLPHGRISQLRLARLQLFQGYEANLPSSVHMCKRQVCFNLLVREEAATLPSIEYLTQMP